MLSALNHVQGFELVNFGLAFFHHLFSRGIPPTLSTCVEIFCEDLLDGKMYLEAWEPKFDFMPLGTAASLADALLAFYGSLDRWESHIVLYMNKPQGLTLRYLRILCLHGRLA